MLPPAIPVTLPPLFMPSGGSLPLHSNATSPPWATASAASRACAARATASACPGATFSLAASPCVPMPAAKLRRRAGATAGGAAAATVRRGPPGTPRPGARVERRRRARRAAESGATAAGVTAAATGPRESPARDPTEPLRPPRRPRAGMEAIVWRRWRRRVLAAGTPSKLPLTSSGSEGGSSWVSQRASWRRKEGGRKRNGREGRVRLASPSISCACSGPPLPTLTQLEWQTPSLSSTPRRKAPDLNLLRRPSSQDVHRLSARDAS